MPVTKCQIHDIEYVTRELATTTYEVCPACELLPSQVKDLEKIEDQFKVNSEVDNEVPPLDVDKVYGEWRDEMDTLDMLNNTDISKLCVQQNEYPPIMEAGKMVMVHLVSDGKRWLLVHF